MEIKFLTNTGLGARFHLTSKALLSKSSPRTSTCTCSLLKMFIEFPLKCESGCLSPTTTLETPA